MALKITMSKQSQFFKYLNTFSMSKNLLKIYENKTLLY